MNNPTGTKEAITADGWYKSGDVCTRDPEGFFHIIDRIKELIKYKARVSQTPSSTILVRECSPFDLGLPRCHRKFEGQGCTLTSYHPIFLVAPAELEALLVHHPKIADAAVIGVYSETDATELPRFVPLHQCLQIHPRQIHPNPPSLLFRTGRTLFRRQNHNQVQNP